MLPNRNQSGREQWDDDDVQCGEEGRGGLQLHRGEQRRQTGDLRPPLRHHQAEGAAAGERDQLAGKRDDGSDLSGLGRSSP